MKFDPKRDVFLSTFDVIRTERKQGGWRLRNEADKADLYVYLHYSAHLCEIEAKVALADMGHQLPQKAQPNLDRLVRFSDFFGLTTRKAIKALAGDYCAEIIRLRQDGRVLTARWNVCLVWCYTLWFVLRSPVDIVLRYLIKSFRG